MTATPGQGIAAGFSKIKTTILEQLEALDRRTYYHIPIRPSYVHVPRVPGEFTDRVVRIIATMMVTSLFAFTSPIRKFAAVINGNGGHVNMGNSHLWSIFDLPMLLGHYATLLGSSPPNLSHDMATLQGPFLTAGVITAIIGLCVALIPYEKKIPKKYWGQEKSSEFASMQDFKRAKLIDHDQPGIVVGAVEPPKRFGIFPRAPRLLIYPGPRHVKLTASSRSGKGVGTVAVTNALWREAGITNCPKIEDYPRNSGVAKHYWGCNVFLWNPGAPKLGSEFIDQEGTRRVEMLGSSGHNLFDEVDWGSDLEFSQTLQLSTMNVCEKREQLEGDNGHWYRTSRVLHRALTYKVAYDPLEALRCYSRVAQLIVGGDDGSEERQALVQTPEEAAENDSLHAMIERYLGFTASGWGPKPTWLVRVIDDRRMRAEREIIELRDKVGVSMTEAQVYAKEIEMRRKLEESVKKLELELRHPDMEADIRQTMRIRGDEAGSVYSTATAKATPWLDPNVIRNTSFSSFTLRSLRNGERPGRLWVGNPLERADFYMPIIRMFYDFALRKYYPPMEPDLVTKVARSPWKYRMIWLMDEMGSLGALEQLNDSLPVMASYGDIWVSIIQTEKQLAAGLGENEVVSDNCGIKLWHTPQNDELAKKISEEKLGHRLILKESVQTSFMGTPTKTLDTKTVPLMSAQEVKAMPSEPDFARDKNGDPLRTPLGNMVKTTRKAYQLIEMTDPQEDTSGQQHGITSMGWSLKVQYFAEWWEPIFRLIVGHETVIPDRTRIQRKDGKTITAQQRAQEAQERVEQPYARNTILRERAELAKRVKLSIIDPSDAATALQHRGIRDVVPQSAEASGEREPAAAVAAATTGGPTAQSVPAPAPAKSAPIPSSFNFVDQ